jgi:peptidoglycan/xylan/chitin deacetylase (PgdA/CDA1 family)
MEFQQIQTIERIPNATIGSHCRTHRRLTELQDPESREEITRSKKELEEILGHGVTLLSYPYGAHRETHLVMAREAGYQRVFSVEPKRNSGTTERIFSAGRIRVDPGDWKIEFRLKVNGSYSWMTIASRIKKMIFRREACQH